MGESNRFPSWIGAEIFAQFAYTSERRILPPRRGVWPWLACGYVCRFFGWRGWLLRPVSQLVGVLDCQIILPLQVRLSGLVVRV